MATSIFSHQPGFVTSLEEPTGMPLIIGGLGGFDGFKAIITKVGVSAQGNYQFLHTLRDFIFVYVFGERIGQIVIQGLTFFDKCPGGGGPTGIESVMGYYNQNRIAATGNTLSIQIGTSSNGRFEGFLTSFQGGVDNPEYLIGSFSLGFHIFPR